MSEPVIVGIVEKNRVEQVRVALTTYNGHPLVDVRVFAAFDGGEMRPTRKGVSLNRGKLPELIAALQAAAEVPR